MERQKLSRNAQARKDSAIVTISLLVIGILAFIPATLILGPIGSICVVAGTLIAIGKANARYS